MSIKAAKELLDNQELNRIFMKINERIHILWAKSSNPEERESLHQKLGALTLVAAEIRNEAERRSEDDD